MGIVYQYDKRHDVTYVFYSESYYVKEKKQSRSKRTLIGRWDPETQKIVPTKKTKRSKPLPLNVFDDTVPHPTGSPNSPDTHHSSDTPGSSEEHQVTNNDVILNLTVKLLDIEGRLKKTEESLQKAEKNLHRKDERITQLISDLESALGKCKLS